MSNRSKWVSFLSRGAALLLSAGLLVSSAGCAGTAGGKDSSGAGDTAGGNYKVVDLNGRTLRIYQYGFRKANASEGTKKFMDRVARIEKEFNCTIELPEDDDYTAVWNDVLAGKPKIDIMQVAAPHLFAQPASNGVFQDLNQFPDAIDPSAEQWDQDLGKMYSLHGHQYALSNGAEFLTNSVMYFNKRLVREAGYDPDDLYKWQEEGTWTWDKFREVAEKVSRLSTADNQIWGCVNNALKLYAGLCISNGTDWVKMDETGAKFIADDPRCVEATDFMMGMVKDKIIPDTSEFKDYQMFVNGQSGFITEYIQRLTEASSGYKTMQDDYGLIMFPKKSADSEYVAFNDWYQGWAICNGIENPEEVAYVYNALFSKDSADKAEQEKKDRASRQSWVRDEGSMAVFDLVEEHSVVSPELFAYPVQGEWSNVMLDVLKSKKTITQALQENKSKYDATLEDIWAIVE